MKVSQGAKKYKNINNGFILYAEQFIEGEGLPFDGEAKNKSLNILNSDGSFMLKTPNGFIPVYWGEYVLNFDGFFYTCSQCFFESNYKEE